MLKLFRKKSVGFAAIVFLLLPIKAAAQGNNPISKVSISSPTAASLAKYGDIPVSYHTGIPQISVPLYTATAGPLKLPVSLNYHAAGLKTQELASWVGAGWSLNAGGVITRSVMGAPDERGTNNGGFQTHGHFSDYGYNNYIENYINTGPASVLTEDWLPFANGRKDGEPDLFFFNFNGASGKFYFNDDRSPVIVPEADFKIEPYYTGTVNESIQGFIITAPDGTKYSFGNTPGITGAPPVEITRPVTADNGPSTSITISSWYLNKISSADDVFKIDLHYETEQYGYHTISMFPINGNPVPGGSPTFGGLHGYELIKNVIDGVRLSSIVFPEGTVVFSSESMPVREDLSDNTEIFNSDNVNTSAKALGSVQIKFEDGSIFKKFNFTYSYFSDNVTQLPAEIANFATLATDKKRLRLDRVQELSGDGTINVPPYLFTYQGNDVARRINFGIDHWGFNNGATNNTTPIPSYTKYGLGTVTNYPGANRNSDAAAMLKGMLTKITYPTGGYTEFMYEPNSVYSTYQSTGIQNLVSLNAHYNGQGQNTDDGVFTVTEGEALKVKFVNSAICCSPYFSITNQSGQHFFGTPLPIPQGTNANGSYIHEYDFSLPAGTYTASLAFNPALPSSEGGSHVEIDHWQTVTGQTTTIIGGNRINKITLYDGVSLMPDGSTPKTIITNYDYSIDNGSSSAVIYSKPVYVGAVRNDLIKNVGYWTTDGFVPYMTANGCLTVGEASYFKSPGSIRPLATTQGYHVGYKKVTVSQTGNGKSVYEYAGSTGVPSWIDADNQVAITTVNVQGCDPNVPNFPPAPLPFDYKLGELKREAYYKEGENEPVKETQYSSTYVDNITTTPAFIAVSNSWGNGSGLVLGTRYELKSAHKTEETVTQTERGAASGNVLTTTKTIYYESPFHNQPTRTVTYNSKEELMETKTRYAFDYRVAACDAIANGFTQFTTDCVSCQQVYTAAVASCNTALCYTNHYINYLHCKTTARKNYVAYQTANFTGPANNFQAAHTAAKTIADGELQPILEMQDRFMNNIVEAGNWKNGSLLSAQYTKYERLVNGAVYPLAGLQIKAALPLNNFALSFLNAGGIASDSRYQPESMYKFENGNLVQVTAKDGITTAYLWGYGNTLPIAKATGATFAQLSTAYQNAANNLTIMRNNPTLKSAMLETYKYTSLQGMISQTDANGKTTYYEYDSFSRLKLIKDQNSNILKKYDYQYQQN